MIAKHLFICAGIFLLLSMYSCTTYYLSTESLNKQLANIDTSAVSQVYDFRLGPVGVLSGKHFYNSIRKVEVTNKAGEKSVLKVTPNMAVKITDKKGRHKIVYFDTMFIRDSLLYGNKSHFVNLPIEPFRLGEIEKLELQK